MRAILAGPLIAEAELSAVARELRLGERDLRIAVDGGLRAWMGSGLGAEVAVGDWDSLGRSDQARKWLAAIPRLELPRAKNRSDLFYACRAAIELGATEII